MFSEFVSMRTSWQLTRTEAAEAQWFDRCITSIAAGLPVTLPIFTGTISPPISPVDYSDRITSYLSELPLPNLLPPLLHWQVDPGALRFKSFRKEIYEAAAQFSSSHREPSIASVRTLRLSFTGDADAPSRQSAPVKKKTSKRRQSMLDATGSLRIQQHNTVRDVLLAELSLCVKFLASPSSQQHTPLRPPSLLNKLGFSQTNVSEFAVKAMVPLANALSRIWEHVRLTLLPKRSSFPLPIVQLSAYGHISSSVAFLPSFLARIETNACSSGPDSQRV
jgi:hypothetical protein